MENNFSPYAFYVQGPETYVQGPCTVVYSPWTGVLGL